MEVSHAGEARARFEITHDCRFPFRATDSTPFAWFCDMLTRIAAHPITKLEDLLPHRWAKARA
jgi:hypothetical protein